MMRPVRWTGRETGESLCSVLRPLATSCLRYAPVVLCLMENDPVSRNEPIRRRGLGFCELTFLGGCITTRLAPDHLRRLPVGAEKGTSHSVALAESGQLRDNVNGVVGVFHQRARRLQAEVLDRLRWCLAGFRLEGPAELARREMCDLGKSVDAQRPRQDCAEHT
jgi:hypothetical protein